MHSNRSQTYVAEIFPSTRVALAVFLIGGPLIYMPLLSALGGRFSLFFPIDAVLGAMVWYLGLANPGFWLLTWIPTGAAGLVTAYLLRRQATSKWYLRAGRAGNSVAGAFLGGVSSGAIYLFSSRLELLLVPAGSSQSRFPPALLGHYGSGTYFAMRWLGTPLVIAVGMVLSGALAWAAYAPNQRSAPRLARELPQSGRF